jgi:hypothetical protein
MKRKLFVVSKGDDHKYGAINYFKKEFVEIIERKIYNEQRGSGQKQTIASYLHPAKHVTASVEYVESCMQGMPPQTSKVSIELLGKEEKDLDEILKNLKG